MKSNTSFYPNETENLLQNEKQFHSLGLYYKNIKEYTKALDIWKR